ncbi:MAG: hypothetical protein ACO1OX_04440 [Novosphingobium sp.]
MIEARADSTGLVRRLTEKAEALAKARGAMLAQGKSAARWRISGLLWPLFGKE